MEEFSPIFIVGSSRSGTTMMNRILGKHIEVSAQNELHYLGKIWDPNQPIQPISRSKALYAASSLIMHIRRGFWDGEVNADERSAAEELIDSRSEWNYLDIYRAVLAKERRIGTKFVIDQTPLNVLYVGKILEYFPDARIIHMVRDPRAVLYSQRNRWKKKWLGASNMPISNVLRVLGNYHPYTLTKLWNRAAYTAYKYDGNKRYMLVVFEKLTSQPSAVVDAICNFLGLKFDPAMLLVPQVGSSNRTHDPSKMGISSDVVDAWMGRLPKGDIYVCEKVAAEAMNKFGYAHVSKASWMVYTLGPVLRFPLHLIASMIFNPKLVYVQIKALVNKK